MIRRTHIVQRSFRTKSIVIALLYGIFGCQIPERPKQITISNAPTFKPLTPTQIESFEQALTAVVSVARDHLDLPVVDPVRLTLYKNSLSFAAYGFGYTTLPIDVANMAATARGSTIHIDLQKTGERLGPELVSVLAHEYAHSIHSLLAGGKILKPHWFSEGFAEWVSAKVSDILGWEKYEVTRYRTYQELTRYKDLLTFNEGEAWNSLLVKPKGRIITYSLGLALVDRLIQDNGLSAMLDYLRTGNFDHSFGTSQSSFIAAFREGLGATGLSQTAASLIDRPDWKIGHQWTYLESRAGLTKEITEEVVSEILAWGAPCFVVRSGDEMHYYAKSTLSLIAVGKAGSLSKKNSKPDRTMYWPLRAGREWQNVFARTDFEEGSTRRVNYMMVAAGDEQIVVPAGSFQAIKIQAYGYRSGHLLSEYWYSPKVNWFVKTRTFRRNEGDIEKQLIRFAKS